MFDAIFPKLTGTVDTVKCRKIKKKTEAKFTSDE